MGFPALKNIFVALQSADSIFLQITSFWSKLSFCKHWTWLEVAFGSAELQQALLPCHVFCSSTSLAPCSAVCVGSWDGQGSNFRRNLLQDSFQPMFCNSFPMFCYLFPISHAGFAFRVRSHSFLITIPRTNHHFTSHPLLFIFSRFLSGLLFCAASSLPLFPFVGQKQSRENT